MASLQNTRSLMAKRPNRMQVINVMLMGKQGTGKTSIFNQLYAHFLSRYPETTYKNLNRFAFNNDKATILIADENILPLPAASQKRLHVVTKADAFILVYALDDEDSFNYVETMKDYIRSQKGEDIPIIVIGNKNDLEERVIQYPLVDCLVSIEWEMKYLELSALKKDKFSLVIGLLLPHKTQPELIPRGQDLDTFEFRGITFRGRSSTDPNGDSEPAPKTRRYFSLRGARRVSKVSVTSLSLPNIFKWRGFSRRK